MEELSGNRGQTSWPQPLALRLAKTSGVRSVYLSAALVKTYQRRDGFLGAYGGRREMLTASLPMISIYQTWSANRNLRSPATQLTGHWTDLEFGPASAARAS